MRPEATGYGVVYFANEMLTDQGSSIRGKRVAISGAGNVALFAAEKLLQLGGIPLSVSDSDGSIVADDGLTWEVLEALKRLKMKSRDRLSKFPSWSGTSFGAATFAEGATYFLAHIG